MFTSTIQRSCLSVGLFVVAAGLVTEAVAQATPQRPISLFRPAPVSPPSGLVSSPADALGMRPDSVGAVSYHALSVEADNTFRSRISAPQGLLIPLPGAGVVTCALNTEVTGDGLVVMSGASGDGGIGNRCDLVVENGRVTGLVDTAAGRYSIRPLEAANVHAVVQVKTEAFPDEKETRARGDRSAAALQSIPMCDVPLRQGQQPKSFGPIRVLIAYTPAARDRRPNIAAEIQTMMGQFRDAMSLRLTGGNFSVSTELAHSVEINYQESDSPSMDMDLERLSDRTDRVFRTLHNLRNTHKADLVHLLIRGRREDGCGIGWTPRDITRIDESVGFTVSDRQCATENLSFAHELGHNLGMKHDRGVEKEAKPGPEEFRFGYVLIEHGVRSTMAYNDVCKQQGKNCRRLLAYSSPNLLYSNQNTGARNVPFGRPINARDAAYNVEVLCRTADIIAKFR